MTVVRNTTESHEHWLKTEKGKFVFSRIQNLLVDLTAPLSGESVLNVECRSGLYLKIFQESGCVLSGTDSSPDRLDMTRAKIGKTADLRQAKPEDLPFSDNEFDIVALIHVLETASDPQKVISEAIRVSRKRVVVGLLNPHSPAGSRRQIKEIFGFGPSTPTRYVRRGDLEFMIGQAMSKPSLRWGSAVFLPDLFRTFFSELEESLPQRNNPFGAFVCVSFPVTYTYRTVQNPLLNVFDVKRRSAPAAPDVVRSMLGRNDR